MSSDDYNAGFNAGQRGNVFAPASADGGAGFMAGQALAHTKYEGSAEWLVAPFVLAPFVAIFYPLATAAALAVGFGAEAMLRIAGLALNSALSLALVWVPALAVFWIVCRRDQQWGLNRPYYIARHAVRMLAFALLANGAATNAAAVAANRPALAPLDAMLSTPIQWLPILLMLIFWQVLFVRASLLRIYWNKKLMSWWLRPKGFPPLYFTWWRKPPSTNVPQAPIPMPGSRDSSRSE
jgi:hypothetical protein